MSDPNTAVGGIPNRTDRGRFLNPWPGGSSLRLRELLRWMLIERVRHPRSPDPYPQSPVRVTPTFRNPHAGDNELLVTWIGHTSFLVQFAHTNVLLDPMWGRRFPPIPLVGVPRRVPPGIDFDALPPIDMIAISHDHYDHLDVSTVRRLIRRYPAARWVAPLGVGAWLRQRGASVAAELNWWQMVRVGALEFGCTPARHGSGRRLGWYRRNHTLWSGWSIRAGQRAVFFAGDTGRHPEFERITREFGPFDAAFLPIGAYDPPWLVQWFHMNPAEAVDAYTDILCANGGRPCTFIATHWGTFKMTDEMMDEPPRLTREAWHCSGLDEALLWIPRHGETRTFS